MAVEMSVGYSDINGVSAKNVFSVDNAAGGLIVVGQLDALTNAKINQASILTPLALAGTKALALAANVESCKFKMAITMSGPAGVAGTRRVRVTLQIPAPLGTLINGLSGDPTDPLFTALLAHVMTSQGGVLDKIESVNYVR